MSSNLESGKRDRLIVSSEGKMCVCGNEMVFEYKSGNVRDEGPPTVSGTWICFGCPNAISVNHEELRVGQWPLFEEWLKRNSRMSRTKAEMEVSA